jgi:uncharacterized membrane protein (UPF0127 family)
VTALPARLASLPVRALPGPGGLVVVDAATALARLRGLAWLDADALPATVGLRFAATRSVHTFGMRFALDLIWLDREGGVVRVDRAVPRRRHRAARRARAVVEVHAGRADAFLAAGLSSWRP